MDVRSTNGVRTVNLSAVETRALAKAEAVLKDLGHFLGEEKYTTASLTVGVAVAKFGRAQAEATRAAAE